ncbi:hypothetical protein ACFE04_003354 [Oxalis oulophora]
MDHCVYRAAEQGIVDVFLEVIDIERYPLGDLVTPHNNSVLHIHLASQAKKGAASISFVNQILTLCPNLLWKLNNNNQTLLHLAARYGHDNIVRLLIEKMREDPDQISLVIENKDKETPLHEAVRFKHIEVVRILIEEDIDGLQGSNEIGETPFYLAVEREYGDIVKVMLESSIRKGAYHGPMGRTALHASVFSNNHELTRLLLLSEWALNKKHDDEGWYPIHYAARYGYTKVVEALLDADTSAAYYVTKKEKMTALHLAARHGHINVMKGLVSRCPCSAELVDARNCNAVHFVMESKKREAIIFVLKTPSLRKLVNEYNGDGNATIHQLAISSGPPILNFIEHPEVDAHKFNKHNFNTLDLLLQFGNYHLVPATEIKSRWVWCGLKRGRRITNINNGDEIQEDGSKEDTWNVKEGRDGNLVAAALIATVAFTAGLTVPGGFKDKTGSPILLQSEAFKVFIVANYVALLLSSMAVLTHLRSIFLEKHHERLIIQSFIKQVSETHFAVISMLIAFVSGTYAILAPSRKFNTGLLVLAIGAYVHHCYKSVRIIRAGNKISLEYILGGRIKKTLSSRFLRKYLTSW